MAIEDPSSGRALSREPGRWQPPPPPPRQETEPAAPFPAGGTLLPPLAIPPLVQELPPPLPRWETPEPPTLEPWPAPSTQAPTSPPSEAPLSPQPRIPNLLIERQLRVISTREHPAEVGEMGQGAHHQQHYHYTEAYSQAYGEALPGGFSQQAFPRIDTTPGEPQAPAIAAQAPAAEVDRDPIDDQQRRIRQLEMELEAAHGEVQALSEMLEELPTIFERKFQQRLQGVLEQRRLLIAENSTLRDRLFGLLPGAGLDGSTDRQLRLPPIPSPRRNRLGDRLLRALGWQSNQDTQAQRHGPGQESVSRSDDGQPRVA